MWWEFLFKKLISSCFHSDIPPGSPLLHGPSSLDNSSMYEMPSHLRASFTFLGITEPLDLDHSHTSLIVWTDSGSLPNVYPFCTGNSALWRFRAWGHRFREPVCWQRRVRAKKGWPSWWAAAPGSSVSYLLDELDAGGQVHPEVDELPLDAFLLVLLLLQHEHVVVEKLLQFLVGEVDAQLLQAVELDVLDAK